MTHSQKTYTRDRLILHGVASDYIRDNPGTTSSQLCQLFALEAYEAVGLLSSVKAGTALGPEQTQEIVDWAIAEQAGHVKIMHCWGITERAARKIAKSVRAYESTKPQKPKRVYATDEALDLAKQFCANHPEVPCEHIARQFGVSGAAIRRCRRINNVKIQVGGSQPAIRVVASKPRRTLYAITTDGEQVDPRRVRDVSKIERFVEVMA
jgi:hypothetical protein